jgi:hypothetical protein
MRDRGDDSPVPSLRGRLAEVYLPALVGDAKASLLRRLGDAASLDEPLFGRSMGLAELEAHVGKLAAWLSERSARFLPSGVVVGGDRDVAEGVLDLRVDGAGLSLPVAVVVERRRAREVSVRVYHATKSVAGARRGPAAAANVSPSFPELVAEQFLALRNHDAAEVFSGFQTDGTVCDGLGQEYDKATLAELLARSDMDLEPRTVADDGKICAVECARNDDTGSLLVFQRGDTGLLCSLRIYDDR